MIPRRNARLVLALIVAIGCAPARAQSPGPQGPEQGAYRQQLWLVPSQDRRVLMRTVVFRPKGPGPFPLVVINSNVMRLAPGGRIYDENNRIILHNVLPATANVLFVQDMNGDVSRVYILRADELELVRQRLQQQR